MYKVLPEQRQNITTNCGSVKNAICAFFKNSRTDTSIYSHDKKLYLHMFDTVDTAFRKSLAVNLRYTYCFLYFIKQIYLLQFLVVQVHQLVQLVQSLPVK